MESFNNPYEGFSLERFSSTPLPDSSDILGISYYAKSLDTVIQDIIREGIHNIPANQKKFLKKNVQYLLQEYLDIRSELDKDHRIILWISVIRLYAINFLIELISREPTSQEKIIESDNGIINFDDIKKKKEKEERYERFGLIDEIEYGKLAKNGYCCEIGLYIQSTPVSSLAIDKIWISLQRVISRFNYILFQKDVEYLVQCLMVRCGEFCSRVSMNGAVFNHPVFIRDDLQYNFKAVNLRFIRETERIFYGLFKRINSHTSLVSPAQLLVVMNERYSADNKECILLLNWLQSWAISRFEDDFQSKFKRRIYDLHLYVGEIERYSEEITFGGLRAYNVISQYRKMDIEKMAEWVLNFHSDTYVDKQEMYSNGYRQGHRIL